METITTIGLDIAKSVFQVHGVDAQGKVIVRRQLKRRHVLAFFQKLPPCLVGIEACASSHYWSRELQALGHTVRLMPPAYVKPSPERISGNRGGGKPRTIGAADGSPMPQWEFANQKGACGRARPWPTRIIAAANAKPSDASRLGRSLALKQ
jgi:hypothetical protein